MRLPNKMQRPGRGFRPEDTDQIGLFRKPPPPQDSKAEVKAQLAHWRCAGGKSTTAEKAWP